MLGGFLPPVVFTITTNAAQAIAGFGKVNAQLKVMEAQALKTGKALSTTTKALTVATAAAKAFAVVMGAFAAYGVKEVMQLEQAYARLGQTLAAVGLSTEQNRTRLADASQAMEMLGFDAANAADAFAILIQTTKDVETSQKLMATAADLARARQMDLTTAARLLSRAQAGNNRIFTMFGIQVDKNKDKITATKEAMDKLTKVIGGQAEAYTKTFAGQLAVLGKQIENVAEGIGAALLPYLMKFIAFIQKAGKFLNEHREILVGIAFVIGTVLVAAVVNLTKKLYAQAIAWAAANWPITLIIASVIALASAFVWAWNKFDWFRKGIVEGMKILLKWWGFLLRAIGAVAEGFLQIVTGPLRLLLKGLGFFNDDAKKMSQELDKLPKKVGDFFDNAATKVEGFSKTVDSIKDKKIDLSKFKLPGLDIPAYENGELFAEQFGEGVVKGLAGAKRKIAEFNAGIKKEFGNIKALWASVVGRDFEADIVAAVNDPIESLIRDAQKSIDAYADASSRYSSVITNLTKAQTAYKSALKTGNTELIKASEEALKRAEDATTSIQDEIGTALADIADYQQQMISRVAELYAEISTLEADRTKILGEAQKERLDLEKDYNKEVLRLRKDYDNSVLKAQQDAANRRAEIVKQSVDRLRDAFRNATYRSIGDIFQELTYEGRYIKGGTADKMLAALGIQTKKAKTLAADAASLAGLGFSQSFIEEVVAQGPDTGHALAQTIINSTPESIRQMQQYWTELQTTSTHGVDKVATELNAGMKLATEELMAQLVQVDTDLAATLKDLQEELQTNLTDAFTTYSNSLDAINTRTAAQVLAIDGQITQLNDKIAQFKSALGSLAGLGTPGTAGAGINIIPQNEAPKTFVPTAPVTPQPPVNPQITPEQYREAFGGGGIAVTVNAQTNASPQEIANDVGWAIRTSGDVQYRTQRGFLPSGRGTMMVAE